MPEDIHKDEESRRWGTRREFLSWGFVASLTGLVGALAHVSIQFAQPLVREGEFGGIFRLGTTGDLPEPNDPPANYPAGKFYLARPEDGVLALHKACTHLDCLCDWDEQAESYVCPCHGSRFALDGAVLSGPATRDLNRFVVQLVDEEGQVVAETDPNSGQPVALPAATGPGGSEQAAEDLGETEPEVDESAPRAARLQVIVDTGRKIPGQVIR